MNTPEYLRQAMSNLQQALTSTRTDIDELTHMIASRDRESKDHLNELHQREVRRLTEASIVDSSLVSGAALNSARQLRNEESRVKDDFTRQKKALDDRLATKHRNVDQINQIIRQLDQILAQVNAPLNI